MSLNKTITDDILKKNSDEIEKILSRNGSILKTMLDDDDDFVEAMLMLSITAIQPGLDGLVFLMGQLAKRDVTRSDILKMMIRIYEGDKSGFDKILRGTEKR